MDSRSRSLGYDAAAEMVLTDTSVNLTGFDKLMIVVLLIGVAAFVIALLVIAIRKPPSTTNNNNNGKIIPKFDKASATLTTAGNYIISYSAPKAKYVRITPTTHVVDRTKTSNLPSSGTIALRNVTSKTVYTLTAVSADGSTSTTAVVITPPPK